MMNWAEYEQEDKHHSPTVFPMIAWVITLAVVIGGALYAGRVSAEPVFKATNEKGVVITLYDDPCELKDQVTNLPFKATWTEGDKTFQGCWAPVTQMGVAQMWFTDKTAFPVPFQAFTKITNA